LLKNPPLQFKNFKLRVKYVPFPCGLTHLFFIFVLVKDKDGIFVQKLTVVYVSAIEHPLKVNTYPK
jgi:hypothetical protein